MSHWKQQLPVQQPVRPAVADGAAATAAAPAGVVTLAAQDAIPPHAAAAPPAFTPVHEVVLPFGSRPFSGQQEARMAEELRQDTTPLDVRSRPGPGGKKLTYMPGWKSVDAANRIFGFNGWSSQVMSLRINFCRETSSKRWNVCVSCTVRVTLKDGSFHEDRGNGSAENYKSEAEALMLAEKEAVTDARKRALKNFGNRLGLSLYVILRPRVIMRALLPHLFHVLHSVSSRADSHLFSFGPGTTTSTCVSSSPQPRDRKRLRGEPGQSSKAPTVLLHGHRLRRARDFSLRLIPTVRLEGRLCNRGRLRSRLEATKMDLPGVASGLGSPPVAQFTKGRPKLPLSSRPDRRRQRKRSGVLV